MIMYSHNIWNEEWRIQTMIMLNTDVVEQKLNQNEIGHWKQHESQCWILSTVIES